MTWNGRNPPNNRCLAIYSLLLGSVRFVLISFGVWYKVWYEAWAKPPTTRGDCERSFAADGAKTAICDETADRCRAVQQRMSESLTALRWEAVIGLTKARDRFRPITAAQRGRRE